MLFSMATLMPGISVSSDPQDLWNHWPESRFDLTPAPCLQHNGLMILLDQLEDRHPQLINTEAVGESFQGREIRMLKMGNGARKILLWSQMHGDEPSATPALLDIAHFLATHANQSWVANILQSYTLLMIPMLNPDGAQHYIRRNAQGIDINRDARSLVTPEGRILKKIRDQYEPMIGFNLHDQDRRTSVGSSGVLATNSVLSVSGDAANTLTEGRKRTKRASAAIVKALAPFMPGGMARYDEDWSPRAFGDNLTAWGTPVVLLESGGLPPGLEFSQLTRLNFVAILATLHGLAKDDLASHDPKIYEQLERNQNDAWSDVALRGGYILQPGSDSAFPADIAFDVFRSDRTLAGCGNDEPISSSIFLVGDASHHGAGQSIELKNELVLASFDAGVEGFEARQWLNRSSLERLAQLGIGQVTWAVEPEHFFDALQLQKSFAMKGLPTVNVVEKGAGLPALKLAEVPDVPDSRRLADVLKALTGNTEFPDVLNSMWFESGSDRTPAPRLRKRRPASLMVISDAPGGEINWRKSEIKSIWLEGHLLQE